MTTSAFSRNRLRYSTNDIFFNTWSSQMAYVLGFTYSDGNIYKGSLSWDIQKRDVGLLKKIKKSMGCTNPIKERPHSVRLRISNQVLVKGAMKHGLIENKSKRIDLPNIPKKYAKDFVRGFLDGDGWIVKRNGRNEVDLGFVSGNRLFLENLSALIYKNTGILRKVREKVKITPKKFKSTTYLLEYYSNNAITVANWIYCKLRTKDLYLDRKYKSYLTYVKLYEYLNSGKKEMTRALQESFGKPLKDILNELFSYNNFSPIEMADVLGVHHSSIYRWLDRFNIRKVVHKNIYG